MPLLRSVFAALLTAGLASGPACAQDYPSRPMRIIVPLPPGSPPDVLARLVGERLQAAWHQPVVVENRPGATGMIGLAAVAQAQPDGYTMGMMFLTHTVLPALFGKVPYDTANAFAPISNLVWIYNVLAVPQGSDIATLDQLIARAKGARGAVTYASGGNGSPAHLIGEGFAQFVGADMLHVPYKGPAEAVQGLLSGDVSAMFATSSVAVPLVKAGKLRALAVTSPTRLATLPDVPMREESGVRGFRMKEWEGLVAPAGTPAAVIARWHDELVRIMAQPDVLRQVRELGMTPADPHTSAEFGTLIRSELDTWTRFIAKAGLRPN